MRMTGVTLRDRKQAAWIREQTWVLENIIAQIKRKTLSLARHVMRSTENRCDYNSKRMAQGEWTRNRERQKAWWRIARRKPEGHERSRWHGIGARLFASSAKRTRKKRLRRFHKWTTIPMPGSCEWQTGARAGWQMCPLTVPNRRKLWQPLLGVGRRLVTVTA